MPDGHGFNFASYRDALGNAKAPRFLAYRVFLHGSLPIRIYCSPDSIHGTAERSKAYQFHGLAAQPPGYPHKELA